ncbi:MAG: SpoIIIAH-like family protein, partial [Eubacteriales bacterium]
QSYRVIERKQVISLKPFFVKKTRLWLTILLAGVVLVAAGLFQLAVGFYGTNVANRAGGPAAGVQINQQESEPRQAEKPNSNQGEPVTEKRQAAGEQKKNGFDGKTARQNEFFVEYRLERDRTRSQQLDLLREIVNNQNSPDETRKEAQRRLLAISQAIDTEMKLENLIKAENFKDTVVFVQDKSATVIIQAPVLTPMDKNRLTEIAVRVTGLQASSIVVIAKV